jgi:hypothetical protein
MVERQWLSRLDGLNKIYGQRVRFSQLSDDQVKALLKALVAKAGLTFYEIVGAYARRRTKIANGLLLVQRDGPRSGFTCGSNPYFIAMVVSPDRREGRGARR